MRKIKFLFFMLLLVFSGSIWAEVPPTYYSYTDGAGTTWVFWLEGNEAHITDATQGGQPFSGVLNIPSTVEKDGTSYPVIGIGMRDLSAYPSKGLIHNDHITGIVFPPGLKQIDRCAFWDCNGITSLTIPGTVKRIKDVCFKGCKSLATLNIENGVEIIENSSFSDCTALHGDLTLQPSIKYIGPECFTGCPFGGTLTVLAQQHEAVSLDPDHSRYKSSIITYYGTSRKMGPFAHVVFGGPTPTSLCGVGVDGDSEISGAQAVDFSKTTSITFLPEVKKIAPYTFQGADFSKIPNFTISSNIEEIGRAAFALISQLKHITIPSTVKTIGEDLFNSCTNLTEITIEPGALTTIPRAMTLWCHQLRKVTLPDNITTLERECFSGCAALTDIRMSKHLVKIGYRAFAGCTGLHGDVNNFLPQTLKYLGVEAFADNMGITGEAIMPPGMEPLNADNVDGVSAGNPFVRTGVYGIRMGTWQKYFGAAPNENPKTNWTNWSGYAGLLYIDARQCGLNLLDYKHQGYKAYKFTREADCDDEEAYRNFGGIAVNGLVYLPSESVFQRAGFPNVSFADRFKAYEYQNEFQGENFIMDGKCQHFYVKDGLDYRVPIAFKAIEAKCDRTFNNTSGKAVSTLYLPYPTNLPNGMIAYELRDKGFDMYGEKAFHFDPLPIGTRLEANHPYLVQVTDGQSHQLPVMHDVDVPVSPKTEDTGIVGTADADWKLYGTTERIDNAHAYEKKAYYLSGNKWWAVQNGVATDYIAPFRCFVASPTGAAPAKSFIMVLHGGTADDINKLEKDTEADIRSGRHEFYSVDGIRMGTDYKQLKSGQMYIVNGKKFYKF